MTMYYDTIEELEAMAEEFKAKAKADPSKSEYWNTKAIAIYEIIVKVDTIEW